jgi:hypothetical protein
MRKVKLLWIPLGIIGGVVFFWLFPLKLLSREGRLVAVDIQPEMIAQVEKRVREAGLANLETHVSDAYHLPLEDESLDRAFLVTVLRSRLPSGADDRPLGREGWLQVGRAPWQLVGLHAQLSEDGVTRYGAVNYEGDSDRHQLHRGHRASNKRGQNHERMASNLFRRDGKKTVRMVGETLVPETRGALRFLPCGHGEITTPA